MKRLDELKRELELIQNLPCLAFNLKDACKDYYEHEIECIEKWNSPNPEIGEVQNDSSKFKA